MYLQSPGKKAHGKKASWQMVPYVLASNPRTVCNIHRLMIFLTCGCEKGQRSFSGLRIQDKGKNEFGKNIFETKLKFLRKENSYVYQHEL